MPATRTKIEISPAAVRRLAGLDDLARVFFPDNSAHRRIFIAVWVAIKYADRQFWPSGHVPAELRSVSPKSTETVRAKMKRLGLIKRVSHFNPAYAGRSGWTFSMRLVSSLRVLEARTTEAMRPSGDRTDEKKDHDSVFYV
jgi:hypothetical protein